MILQNELKKKLSEKLSFTDLVKTIDGISDKDFVRKVLKVGFSSNVIVDQSQYFFKKQGILRNIDCQVFYGDYQTQFLNVQKFIEKEANVIILQNLFDNIQPSFESQIHNLDDKKISDIHDAFFKEMSLSLEAAQNVKQVVIDKFFLINHLQGANPSGRVLATLDKFNQSLENLSKKYANCTLFDPQPLVHLCGGISGSLNLRYYYHFKTPFSLSYWNEYAKEILLTSRFGQTFYYKVLVLDCDNTLWGGVVGEDLLQGIQLDPAQYPGSVFWRIQNEILSLQKEGILICLCSKNNAADVEEVIEKHPFQVIKNEHIVFKKVNWQSKVENIKELAQQLNLGLDSFIFVDDSDFEINSVKEMLPEVSTFQVPKNLYEYPALLSEIRRLFLSGGVDKSSAEKTQQYLILAKAENEKIQFSNFDDYIKSLEIKVKVECNNLTQVSRIAELTQKSNQFNLTTKRYTESEVVAMMNSESVDIFSISVSDKFGNSGLTGVAIVKSGATEQIEIDSFLMSCRVIGRTIEYSCWMPIFKKYKSLGKSKVSAFYQETQKNAQVSNYFESLGFDLLKKDEKMKYYIKNIDELNMKDSSSIEVTYDF